MPFSVPHIDDGSETPCANRNVLSSFANDSVDSLADRIARARSRARGLAQQRSCVDVPGGLARIRQGRRSGERARLLDFGRDLGRHGAFHFGVERDAKFLAETPNWVALLPLFEFPSSLR